MSFHGEAFLAPRPNPKLEDHPSSAVRDCLFNLFAATLHIRGRSSIRNLRKRHAVVTGTHVTWLRCSCTILFWCSCIGIPVLLVLHYVIWCFSDRASYYRLISFTNFNAQFLYSLTYVCNITILDMFRALTCPSSGGKIVFTQHLVSYFIHRIVSSTNFNAQFLYSLTIYMLHYNPRHVSSCRLYDVAPCEHSAISKRAIYTSSFQYFGAAKGFILMTLNTCFCSSGAFHFMLLIIPHQ